MSIAVTRSVGNGFFAMSTPILPTGAPRDALPSTHEADASSSFSFTPLDMKHSFPSLQTDEAREKLTQWNMLPFMKHASFRFDQAFSADQSDAFLMDFFASAAVQQVAPVCVGPGQWGVLGSLGAGAVKYTRLPTTVLRLDFFDRLKEAGIVREGDIAKCFDVQCGEVLVSDRLRKALLDESDEEWELFSEAERKELIFHIMKRLAVGGGMNQYDDSIEPYLKLTKAVYKDMVTVNKSAGGSLQVVSNTFLVESVAGSSSSLYPRRGDHNFCYVVVDPVSRHVKIWYSAWFPMM